MMSENFDEVLSAALSLSPGARAMLADHLLSSLDAENERRIEAIWVEEAERRAWAIDEGRTKPIPGEEVMASTRERRAKR
jgi:putative addiction module component (TIGR02574 family)